MAYLALPTHPLRRLALRDAASRKATVSRLRRHSKVTAFSSQGDTFGLKVSVLAAKATLSGLTAHYRVTRVNLMSRTRLNDAR